MRASRKCISEGPGMMEASQRDLPSTRKPMRVLRAPETTNTPPTPSPESRLRSMAQRRALQASTLSAEAGKRRGPTATATCRASRPRNCHPRAARPVSRTRRRLCAARKWPSVNADPHELSEDRPTSEPSRSTAAFSARAVHAAVSRVDQNGVSVGEQYFFGGWLTFSASRSVDAYDHGPPLDGLGPAPFAASGEQGALRRGAPQGSTANTAPF